MKLLIVDDNSQMREMIKAVVQDLAEDIHECADGSEALAAYDEFLPDWVLMDIKMKEVDGLTATSQIMAAFPGAKIIVVTGYDDADLRKAATLVGACGFVAKEDLVSMRRLLTRC